MKKHEVVLIAIAMLLCGLLIGWTVDHQVCHAEDSQILDCK